MSSDQLGERERHWTERHFPLVVLPFAVLNFAIVWLFPSQLDVLFIPAAAITASGVILAAAFEVEVLYKNGI